MTKILESIRKSYTRLRKRPLTFVEGFASSLDANSSILEGYKTDKTDELADSNAIHSDWVAVGKDMYVALDIYGKSGNQS